MSDTQTPKKKTNCKWKDGPGNMSYPETVVVNKITRVPNKQVKYDDVYFLFTAFDSPTQVTWDLNDSCIMYGSVENLSNAQIEYLEFLAKLWGTTIYKDIEI